MDERDSTTNRLKSDIEAAMARATRAEEQKLAAEDRAATLAAQLLIRSQSLHHEEARHKTLSAELEDKAAELRVWREYFERGPALHRSARPSALPDDRVSRYHVADTSSVFQSATRRERPVRQAIATPTADAPTGPRSMVAEAYFEDLASPVGVRLSNTYSMSSSRPPSRRRTDHYDGRRPDKFARMA